MAAATITCPNCGVQNPASDTICFFCRHALSGSDTAPTVHSAPIDPPASRKAASVHPANQPLPNPAVSAHPANQPAPPPAVSTPQPVRQPVQSPSAPTQFASDASADQALLHGRYRVLRALGRGGMGAVFLAQDSQLGNRLIAVKEMSQGNLSPQDIQVAVETFKHEAYLLAGLQHPNLPSIHDYFEQNGHWYLVMSFIQGESLEKYLVHAPGRRLPLAEVLQIARELCNVLDYLHCQQPPIIFRDLKPSNIMRTPDGHIYLIDFGIARLFKPGQAKDTATYGSMGYAPPEQDGRTQPTTRSDIYSLGVTLYELLSGYAPSSSPFRLPPLQSLMPTLPPRLVDLITRMTDLDEARRPASIKDVQRILL